MTRLSSYFVYLCLLTSCTVRPLPNVSTYGNIVSLDQNEIIETYIGNTVIRGDGRQVYYDSNGTLIVHHSSGTMQPSEYLTGRWDVCSSKEVYQGAGLLCFTIGDSFQEMSNHGIRGIRLFDIKGKFHENLFSKKYQIEVIQGKTGSMKAFSEDIARIKAQERARARKAELLSLGGSNLIRCGLKVYGPDLCHEMLKAGTKGGLSADTINSPACTALILDSLGLEPTQQDYIIAGVTGALDDLTTYGRAAERDWEKSVGDFASIMSMGTKATLMLDCIFN